MDITRRTSFATLAGAATLGACATPQSEAARDGLTPTAFAAWLDGYKAAWEARDAARAGALFTEDASYHEMPFEAPMMGRAAIEAYWTRVTAGQSNVRFSSEVVACEGDQGAAHWHATFNAGSDVVDMDGMFVCAFAPSGQVRSLREWWHVQVGPGAS